jgi:hypothetical protein
MHKLIQTIILIKKNKRKEKEHNSYSSCRGRSVAWKQYTLPQDTAVLHFEA